MSDLERKPQKRPTIRDVARVANVSHQTVSRFLNNPGSLKDETRSRVKEAIEGLEYNPSPMARGLASNSSKLIGVIDSGSAVHGQLLILADVLSAARAYGYSVRHLFVDPHVSGRLDDAIETLHSERVDGIIILANTTLHVQVASELATRVAVVAVAPEVEDSSSMSVVSVDQRGGAHQVLQHMQDRGRQRIGHIRGPLGWVDSDIRHEVWSEYVPSSQRAEWLVVGDFGPESGYRATSRLLEVGCDAVFAANDYMALGVIRACYELGVDVPWQLAIVGFDDIVTAGYLTPPLTTVRQPFGTIGHHAVELLIDLLQGGSSKRIELSTELIVRQSA